MAVPIRLLLLCASLASFGCSDDPDPHLTTQSLSQAALACGPDGYVLPDALPGDVYLADDPAIQSVVVSGGDVRSTVDGEAWSFVVASRVSLVVPLVIQLRDVDHRTLCTGLE